MSLRKGAEKAEWGHGEVPEKWGVVGRGRGKERREAHPLWQVQGAPWG